MCYFLYGSLYGDVSESEYVDVKNKYGLKISLGTKHDVKSAVKAAANLSKTTFVLQIGFATVTALLAGTIPRIP